MERTDVLELMSTLKLYGMRAAYDEVMTTGIKRRHEPPRIVGDLLAAEIAEKQARSIKYQLTIAKLPLAKDIDDFDFADTTINETLVRDLAGGAFLAEQRNAVLVGGTSTGKSHLAIAIAPRLHPRRRPRPLLHRCRPRQPAGERSGIPRSGSSNGFATSTAMPAGSPLLRTTCWRAGCGSARCSCRCGTILAMRRRILARLWRRSPGWNAGS